MSKAFLFFLCFLSFRYCSSQSPAEYAGSWSGTLSMGADLRIVFNIKEAAGKLSATADSPDQGAFGLTCDTTYLDASGIHIEMRNLRAAFAGKLTGDSAIIGTFTQGAPVPLVLRRSTGGAQNNRPQEPLGPLPYQSTDIEFTSSLTGLTYGGTITIPPGKGPFPAAVLISGSGPQNRDEELMGHRPFLVLADALTRNGILVLRVDDRGVGKTSGEFSSATSADFADDASAVLDYLLTRPEVNRKKAGLVGHSEGGMIAPIVASRRKDLDFVILLAAPGIPIMDLMTEQNSAILRSSGLRDSAIAAYSPFYQKLMKTLTEGADSALAVNNASAYMESWAATTDSALLKELQLSSAPARKQVFQAMADVARNPWFLYFMKFDPRPYLEQMSMKVLALNGEKDVQVIAASNMNGIRMAQEKKNAKNFTGIILPGLNHLFQSCKECTVPEYARLTETFSPVALKEINDWINKKVK